MFCAGSACQMLLCSMASTAVFKSTAAAHGLCHHVRVSDAVAALVRSAISPQLSAEVIGSGGPGGDGDGLKACGNVSSGVRCGLAVDVWCAVVAVDDT